VTNENIQFYDIIVKLTNNFKVIDFVERLYDVTEY
jgi:hypothetical protein